MNKYNKFAFILFAFVAAFICKDFIKRGFSEFYLYRIDKTERARAVILNANFDDAISGMTWQCSYLYRVRGKKFEKFENISVYDTLIKFKVGDSLPVKYNVKRPWDASIDTDYNLRIHFFAGLILMIWLIAAIVLFIIEIDKYLRHKNRLK